ncbi:MAG: 2TM domain-containing protein [Flavobacteriaceae bacterium]|uniref:2TM domain-containing protein n=1 Tax=Flagellimonas algarum TaxID=3230298 RepID=UPI003390D3C7|nr:2TM domain-containing protein [Flavobacteriaceae bacterium]
METTQDYRYQKAKEKVEAIKGFYGNLTAYAIVIPLLALLNYYTTSFPWVIFPAIGWGIGVIAHGFGAFGYMPFLGKDWEERKIKEYMESDTF